jgi:hypothetical protein
MQLPMPRTPEELEMFMLHKTVSEIQYSPLSPGFYKIRGTPLTVFKSVAIPLFPAMSVALPDKVAQKLMREGELLANVMERKKVEDKLGEMLAVERDKAKMELVLAMLEDSTSEKRVKKEEKSGGSLRIMRLKSLESEMSFLGLDKPKRFADGGRKKSKSESLLWSSDSSTETDD